VGVVAGKTMTLLLDLVSVPDPESTPESVSVCKPATVEEVEMITLFATFAPCHPPATCRRLSVRSPAPSAPLFPMAIAPA
jgi:hypothetical protein